MGQQNAQVSKIISSRPSDNRVAQAIEERVGVEPCERTPHGLSVPADTKHRASVNHRPGGWTVPVDAIGPCTQDSYVVSRNRFGAGQRELLVAPARPPVSNGNCYFSS